MTTERKELIRKEIEKQFRYFMNAQVSKGSTLEQAQKEFEKFREEITKKVEANELI